MPLISKSADGRLIFCNELISHVDKNTTASGGVTDAPGLDICSNAKLSTSLLPTRHSPLTVVISPCRVRCELSIEFKLLVYSLPKLRQTNICNSYD